jgi:glycosyltransferase involved in cell wall biosynthesis
MDLEPVLTLEKERVEQPILIWNHRWEYDKNPEAFFEALKQLKEEGISFQLIVCGEKTKKYPRVFDQLKEVFADELIHFGYAASRKEYLELLRRATVLPVTSNQDFFGGSVVEGIAAGCIPVLPQRLAYPEHLPDQLKDEYMANNDKEWYELLKDVVKNYEIHAKNTAVLRQFVARYDWKAQSTGYAEMLK